MYRLLIYIDRQRLFKDRRSSTLLEEPSVASAFKPMTSGHAEMRDRIRKEKAEKAERESFAKTVKKGRSMANKEEPKLKAREGWAESDRTYAPTKTNGDLVANTGAKAERSMTKSTETKTRRGIPSSMSPRQAEASKRSSSAPYRKSPMLGNSAKKTEGLRPLETRANDSKASYKAPPTSVNSGSASSNKIKASTGSVWKSQTETGYGDIQDIQSTQGTKYGNKKKTKSDWSY